MRASDPHQKYKGELDPASRAELKALCRGTVLLALEIHYAKALMWWKKSHSCMGHYPLRAEQRNRFPKAAVLCGFAAANLVLFLFF